LLGVAELYNTHPDFVARFKAFDPNLGAFMREAVGMYVKRKK
jgi:hypothetical protein